MKLFSSSRSCGFKIFLFTIFLGANLIAVVKTANSQTSTHYSIDTKNSHFYVLTDNDGLFSGLGHKHKIGISGFSGDIIFDPKNLSNASLNMTVLSNSLFLVTDSKKDDGNKPKIEENMRNKVLEIVAFPKVSFVSKEISLTPTTTNEFDARIKGDLTLHGKTRSILIPAKINLESTQLSAKGEFSLKQSDYGIQTPSAAAGTVKVKDEVKLTFEMIAHP